MSNSNFAIYVNSASSILPNNEKSRISIPFLSNIAKHDALKSAELSLLTFRFVNSVYNIKEGYNKLKVLTKYAAGRGLPESEEFITLEVPFGNYDADKLANYFSTVSNLGFEVIQQLFQYADAGYSANCNIYVGFGAYPLGEENPEITPALSYDSTQTKLFFQSPDLKHLIQYKVDTMTPCTNLTSNEYDDPTTILQHSYIYDGIYLVLDSETEGLMSLLGFEISNRFEVPVVSTLGGNIKRGYGIKFEHRNMYGNSVNPFTDPTTIPNYDISLARVEYGYYSTILGKKVWPVIDSTIQFQGLFYEEGTILTVPTTTADLQSPSNPKGEINFLPVSSLITGTNITNGSPIVVSLVQTFFQAEVRSKLVGTQVQYRLQWNHDYPALNENEGPSVGMALTNAGEWTPEDGWPTDTPVNGMIGKIVTARPRISGNYYQIELSDNTEAPFYYDENGDQVPYTVSDDNTHVPYNWYGFMYILSLPQPQDLTLLDMVSSKGQLINPSAPLFPQNVTNLSGLDEIYLKCAQLHTLAYASTNKQPLAPSDTIAVIPVDVPYAEKQTFMPQFPVSCALNNTNITQLDFVLTNSKNELLDFNGVDWSAVMAVTMTDIPAIEDPGTFNTPFQSQLNVLEGTATSEMRRKRQMIFHSQSKF